MVVEHDDLADGARVLELEDGLLLYAEDDDILSADTDGAGSTPDCLERVLDLQRAG